MSTGVTDYQTFASIAEQSAHQNTLIKITLSKPRQASDLKNVFIRLVEIKGKTTWSFTYRYQTRDEVKNYDGKEAFRLIEEYLTVDFFIGHLFATDKDVMVESSKKGKTRLQTQKPTLVTPPTRQHDKQKQRFVQPERPYLHSLGITTESGTITKQGQAKYKQIDKYIEILHHLMAEVELPSPLKIADMGSGKGYLTFALYDYLTNVQQRQVVFQGVELRPQLVELCNQIAQALSFDGLSFSAQDMNDFSASELDVLIALHACDTATDVAIAKGIQANAQIIVCAPCCHKQIRQQMKGNPNLQPVLKHGILEERQAEILTDGIRALLLEAHGYATKVFEFISTEHTGKNLMIVGIQQHRPNLKALEQVNILKQQFGIEFHHLERLLEERREE